MFNPDNNQFLFNDQIDLENAPFQDTIENNPILFNDAVSRQITDLLQPCVQNSVRPKRFSKIIRELHMLEHDRLELMYLHIIIMKKEKEAEGVCSFFTTQPITYALFLSFDNQLTYTGYVPPVVYFETLYTSIIGTETLYEQTAYVNRWKNDAWGFNQNLEIGASSNGVDTIQIAYDKDIIIPHVTNIWNTLPASLVNMLKNRNILKVGKQVSGDLNRIQRSFTGVICESPVELGTFCKRRNLIEHGKLSLSDISAKVLGYTLNKDERLGNWSVSLLSEAQKKYAALDAWASLKIYEKAVKLPEVGTRLSYRSIVVPGTYVQYRPRDASGCVALGRVDEQTDEDKRRFHITTGYLAASRVIVTILHVSAPGYIPRSIARLPPCIFFYKK